MLVNRNCTNQLTGELIKGGSFLQNYAPGDAKSIFCTGRVNGVDVKIPMNCVEVYEVGTAEVPSYTPIHTFFPKQEKRIMVFKDSEDLNNPTYIKEDTIAEDWIDNEDGTYEFSVDGLDIHRVWAKDVIKLMN